MDISYQNNSEAQTSCHVMASNLLIKASMKLSNKKDIKIGVFGCGPGNNDLDAIEKYIVPYLPNSKIEIYMIDIVETKWLKIKKKSNLKIFGLLKDLYTPIFENKFLDLVLSFSCLHWFDYLPENYLFENKYCYSLSKKSNKQLIKKIMDDRLSLFLKLRSNELKLEGEIILTFDAEINNEPHHFQSITECASKALEYVVDNNNIEKIKLNKCFIQTSPRTMKEVLNAINKNKSLDYLKSEIYIKKASCPFNNNKLKLTDSIISCIKPNLEQNIPNLIDQVKKYIIENINNNYSTEGNVLIMKTTKI